MNDNAGPRTCLHKGTIKNDKAFPFHFFYTTSSTTKTRRLTASAGILFSFANFYRPHFSPVSGASSALVCRTCGSRSGIAVVTCIMVSVLEQFTAFGTDNGMPFLAFYSHSVAYASGTCKDVALKCLIVIVTDMKPQSVSSASCASCNPPLSSWPPTLLSWNFSSPFTRSSCMPTPSPRSSSSAAG